MKLLSGCTDECIVCGAKSCDHNVTMSDTFTRAGLDTLLYRLDNYIYTGEDREKIKTWIKVQFNYIYNERG